MSETSKRGRGCLVRGIWGSSLLLFFIVLFLGLSEVISETTAYILYIISLSLLVIGFVTLNWKAKKKPETQIREDSQLEESEKQGQG